MPREAPKAAAVLTIRDADKMTSRGRRDVARWLRERADDLDQHGSQLAGRFIARYMYRRAK